MNIQEMHIGVGLGIQKVNSNAFDSFIDEEIDYYLNKAQREYVRRQNVFLKDRLENLSRPDKISSSEARENLGQLIANANRSTPVNEPSFSNAVSFTVPSMFQYLYANARVNSPTGPWVSCKLISPYDVHIYSNSEHNKPLFREIPLLIAGDKFILFKDSRTSSIEELEVFYISIPTTVSLSGPTDSNLPEHTHDEIVDIAVNMILGDLKVAGPTQHEQQSIREEI